eukprot:gene9854-18439_t
MDDDEDVRYGSDTYVDRGHVNNSNVKVKGDGNNYIGDDNVSVAITGGNGTVRDGGMVEGDLGNTSTEPSSISKSIEQFERKQELQLHSPLE